MCPIPEIDYSYQHPATENMNTEQFLAADHKIQDKVTFHNDVVDISSEARKCAECAGQDTTQAMDASKNTTPAIPPQLMEEPLPEGSLTQALGSMTLDSGRTVTIEKFTIPAEVNALPQTQNSSKDSAPTKGTHTAASANDLASDNAASADVEMKANPAPLYGYRAVIHAADGQSSQSYLLKSDTIINEDSDGVLHLSSYTAGDETSGDDFIVGFQGKVLNGGSGNDTIIEMSADYNEHTGQAAAPEAGATSEVEQPAAASINSGSGDDTVILVGKRVMSVSVSTGSGNDTIISTGDIEISKMDTGSGDDTIKIRGNLSIRGDMVAAGTFTRTDSQQGPIFRTGSGNDTIEVDGNLDIKGGNVTITYETPGEDIYFDIGGDGALGRRENLVSLDTGSGDDTIRVAGSLQMDSGVIRTGGGDDSIFVEENLKMDSEYLHVGWDVMKSSIDTGDGDDRISAGKGIHMNKSEIMTGSGDDRISADKGIHMDDSEIATDSGDDTITAHNIMAKHDSVISTGDGDDTIAANRNLSLHYRSAIISGDGDDTIHAGAMLHMYWEGIMNTGKGDDTISSGRNMTIDVYSLVKTGDGDDTMKAANRLHVDGDSIVHTGEGDDKIRGGRGFSTDGHALVYTSGGSDSISAGRRMHSDGGSAIHTGYGNDYILAGLGSGMNSGMGVHGNSWVLTGDGNDTIKATNLTITKGSTLRTGKGNDHIQAHELHVGGRLNTGDGNDTIKADKMILWGNSNSGMQNIPYSLFQFPEIAEGPFKGINTYQKTMMSGNFDPEELTKTRQEYLEALLRSHGYNGDLE